MPSNPRPYTWELAEQVDITSLDSVTYYAKEKEMLYRLFSIVHDFRDLKWDYDTVDLAWINELEDEIVAIWNMIGMMQFWQGWNKGYQRGRDERKS